MKYVKTYEVINENKRNAKRFKNKGGLMRNDQFSGNVSLSKTLADELGFDLKKEFTEGIGFDDISMYDTASGKTIIDDALSGKHTYDDLVKVAKEWYKKNESADVNEGFSSKSDFNKIRKALSQGKTVTARHARFPMAITIKEIDPKGMYATVDFNDGQGDSEMAAMNIDPRSIKISESVDLNEAKKFKPGDKWSNDFDYEGMLKFASKVNANTPIKTLNDLFDSATDVNYHTPFRNLGIAIDWIEDGDKKGAKDYIKMFKDDIKKEMKSQGIK